MDRRFLGLTTAALAFGCAPATTTTDVGMTPAPAAVSPAQAGWVIAHDEGAFFTRLGNDTILVEQFMLHGQTLEVAAVTRSPRTMMRTHRIMWNDAGIVQSYTVTTGDETRTVNLPAGEQQGVFAPPLLSPYVALARIAAATGAATVQMGEIPLAVSRPQPGWLALHNPELGTIRVRLDDQLRAQEIDARGSSLGGYGVRVAPLDVAAWRTEFAARDAAGRGLGPLSPPDSVRATVSGANIAINYHRPSARGRTIFGGVVRWGQVWRTGANQATAFTTDRDLMIGNTRVPAGEYTIWSLPTQDGWHLILNKQTGQWGTQYNAEQDLAHIPLQVETLSTPVEQFTIGIAADGTLSLAWGDRRGTVPVTAAP
jgi:hypothetical protein